LVGEGSECFGFDDELSRDHDWGPSFCIWLTKAEYERVGTKLETVYEQVTATAFRGVAPRVDTPTAYGRVGVNTISRFYRRYLGVDRLPEDINGWRALQEEALAVVTNGKVFVDEPGIFTRVREGFLNYYPDDLRLKRLSAACMKASQAGQHNLERSLLRSSSLAAFSALSRYIEELTHCAYILNRRFRPYYKWAQAGLDVLPHTGAALSCELEGLLNCWAQWVAHREHGEAAHSARLQLMEQVERAAACIVEGMRLEGLTSATTCYLADHTPALLAAITDESLRKLHSMLS
jgi:hypothetical protein